MKKENSFFFGNSVEIVRVSPAPERIPRVREMNSVIRSNRASPSNKVIWPRGERCGKIGSSQRESGIKKKL